MTHDFDEEEPVRRIQAPIAAPRPAPTRQLPASEEAEQHVIACCLIEGSDTLARCLDARLAPESFYFPANRAIFGIITDLYQQGAAITLETLAEELKTRRQLDQVGGFAYLMQVTGGVPTTAHASFFIERVQTLATLRASIKAHTQAVEEAYNFTGDLKTYLQVAQARVDAIGTAATKATRADQLARIADHRVHVATPPKEPQTRLFLADKPIATPGNIVTITSKAKTGKTAALGGATAAIIAASAGTATLRDTFKFRASNPDGHAVIVIDTEQSPYDAYLCYQRSLKRAATEEDPKWLRHYSFVGLGPSELKQALDLILEQARADHQGIFAIILDGCADFVSSVNDEAESNGFVTWLRARTVDYDCPAICVIHSNEGDKAGDDSRGHLGKQLIRKAESNLMLKKDGEITTITSDKQRKAPITRNDNVAFRWSDEHQMHVSCESGEPKSKAVGRGRKHTINEFMDCLPKPGQPPLTGTQLHRFAIQIAEIKPQTFKDLLNQAAEDGVLVKTFDQKTGYSYVRSL